MKIGNLKQHCGSCGIISYCGNPFGYCLCQDERFSDINEDIYVRIADSCKLESYPECGNCTRDDCETCDLEYEKKDYECELIADYVAKRLDV